MSTALMSRADEFRQEVKEFWSSFDQGKTLATVQKTTPTGVSTRPRTGRVALKLKKKIKS